VLVRPWPVRCTGALHGLLMSDNACALHSSSEVPATSVPCARFPMGGSKFDKLSDLNGDVPLDFLIHVNGRFRWLRFSFPKGIGQ
jgi:hypothetical protein